MKVTPQEVAAWKSGFNEGLEAAAEIAEPAYQKATYGKWAKIRIDIAARIRACKVRNDAA